MDKQLKGNGTSILKGEGCRIRIKKNAMNI
jgi:hypothetical protein